MDLVCVGLNHRSAPVEIREKIAFRAERLPEHLKALVGRQGVREAVILSTCNRVELYARGVDEVAGPELQRFLHHEHGLAPGILDEHLFMHAGPDALQHLFRVACSLDALVVGEPQILGQVKDAFKYAVEAASVGPLLSRVFHRAFGVAKRVRSETGIAQSAVSVSYAAVELSRTIFGSLRDSVCLLVGAGNMAELAARHFVQDGADLWVVNRSYARAESLAATFGGSARAFNDLALLLEKADVVLTSTAAPGFLLTRELMKDVIRARRYKPIFLIDIAVPRNIDPAAAELEGVYVYDVDDLSKVVDRNLQKRQEEARKAESMVSAEVKEFQDWFRSQSVVPTIKALRRRAQSVAEAEVQKTLAILGPDVGEKERKSVQAMANAVVNKLLHEPMAALRKASGLDDDDLVASAQRLFNLVVMEEAAPAVTGASGEAAATVQKAALAALAAAEEAEAAGGSAPVLSKVSGAEVP